LIFLLSKEMLSTYPIKRKTLNFVTGTRTYGSFQAI
jgi:hypothetical protein